MYIKMTELHKAYLMSKKDNVQEAAGTQFYIELTYNGQIRDLEEAFNKVIVSQPMLRAKILDNETFLIEDTLNYNIEIMDNPCTEQSLVELKRKELLHKNYRLSDYPLFTMVAIGKNENYRILFSVDQMIMDGISLYELIRQIKLYLSNPLISIHDYSTEVLAMQNFYQEMRSSKYYQASRDYYLSNMEHIFQSPQINYSTEKTTDKMFLRKDCTISSELYAKLKSKADQLSCSVTNLLLTLYSLILSKWSKEQNFSLSITSFNRQQDETYYKTIGNFASTFLLQTGFDFEKSLVDNVQKVNNDFDEAFKYKHFEVVEIMCEQQKKSASATIPVVFTSMLDNKNDDLFHDVFKLEYCYSHNTQVYLELVSQNINNELNISWNYRRDMFENAIIDTMFSEYKSLLYKFLDSNEDVISSYYNQKKSRLISLYKNYNTQACNTNFEFHTLKSHFERTSQEYPEKIFAIINNVEYSFGQLFEMATQKASEIQKIKKAYNKDKVRIAFNGKKTIHSITCILATVITNDSFCTINEYFGEEKTEDILATLQNYLYFKDGELVKVSDSNVPVDAEESYIIYTSGTTGQPKGIIITEKAALNTVYDIIKKFNITKEDTVMNISNLYFDLSIFDIFGAIITGMSIVFVDSYEHDWFFEQNYHNKVTIWNSTPALAKEFLLNNKFENLRGILVSGDFVPKKMVEEIFSEYKHITLYALGGATEASIWSNYYDCSSYETVSSIPYGIPLANQQLYVIDSRGSLCDYRVLGEISIAGKGLAKGYLSEEQTKEAFVWDEELGELVYKTGDLGYLGSDNLIYIVGRVASEIKHNGYRIDLREVEKYINMNKDITNSVAFIKKLEDGLCCGL